MKFMSSLDAAQRDKEQSLLSLEVTMQKYIEHKLPIPERLHQRKRKLEKDIEKLDAQEAECDSPSPKARKVREDPSDEPGEEEGEGE